MACRINALLWRKLREVKNGRARVMTAKPSSSGREGLLEYFDDCVLVSQTWTGGKNNIVNHTYLFLLCCFFYGTDFSIRFVGFTWFLAMIQCPYNGVFFRISVSLFYTYRLLSIFCQHSQWSHPEHHLLKHYFLNLRVPWLSSTAGT